MSASTEQVDARSASVQVAVRLRPMNSKEEARDTLPVVTANSAKSEVTLIRGSAQRQQRQTQLFDSVFGSFSSSARSSTACARSSTTSCTATRRRCARSTLHVPSFKILNAARRARCSLFCVHRSSRTARPAPARPTRWRATSRTSARRASSRAPSRASSSSSRASSTPPRPSRRPTSRFTMRSSPTCSTWAAARMVLRRRRRARWALAASRPAARQRTSPARARTPARSSRS